MNVPRPTYHVNFQEKKVHKQNSHAFEEKAAPKPEDRGYNLVCGVQLHCSNLQEHSENRNTAFNRRFSNLLMSMVLGLNPLPTAKSLLRIYPRCSSPCSA